VLRAVVAQVRPEADADEKPARRAPSRSAVRDAAALIREARRPVFYGGGGLINSGAAACEAFARLVRETGAPCTQTLMGLGAFPASDDQFLGMLGMHGTLEANLAMHHADLVVCVGARFDDRVTGKLSDFCPQAKKIHVDVDPSSINKLVRVDVMTSVIRCWMCAGRTGAMSLSRTLRLVVADRQWRARGRSVRDPRGSSSRSS
jgi:acetolactate synthase-1/2/3 large subunit